MSIYVEIGSRVNEQRLFFLSPAIPGSLVIRKMYISSEIKNMIFGPWDSLEWGERCGRLRQDFDHFIEGHKIDVAESPFKGKTSYLKRLEPQREEAWEIRSRDPEPSLRIFGRFADKNVFVALSWHKRADLLGPHSREWRDAIEQCKTEWRNLFPAYQPMTGAKLHDYVTNIVPV